MQTKHVSLCGESLKRFNDNCADTSVLLDVLKSLGTEKSQEQISEFVKGGGVSLLIEAINSRGISVDGTFLLHSI